MFPTLSNRLLAAAAIVIGAWVWVSAVDALRAEDGSAGLSLMMAHGGLAAALATVLLAALPAIALSLLCSSVSNPLCGIFTLATALWVVAAHGEPIDAWIHRNHASLPGDYFMLAVEALVWTVLLAGFIVLIVLARPAIRRSLPILTRDRHLGEEPTLSAGWLPTLVSAGVTAIIAGILAYFLVRTPDKGQVIGGLMLAFMIAALVGDLVATFLFHRHPENPMWIVLAPALVAVIAYLFAGAWYSDEPAFLQAYFQLKVPGTALALPIDYAGAAVAGCALGAGWSQVIMHDQEQLPTPTAAARSAA